MEDSRPTRIITGPRCRGGYIEDNKLAEAPRVTSLEIVGSKSHKRDESCNALHRGSHAIHNKEERSQERRMHLEEEHLKNKYTLRKKHLEGQMVKQGDRGRIRTCFKAK